MAITIELNPCPFPNTDSCEICARLYFRIDGQLEFERKCRRYESVDAQKQAIRDSHQGHVITFEDETNPYQRKKISEAQQNV